MQKFRRLLALALVFVFAAALVPAASALDFSDGEQIENTEAVELLVSLGIIKGHDDGRFDPQGNLTRAEAAKIIYVATRGEDDGAEIFAGSNLFSDVPKGLWSQGYINYAAVMDYVAGDGDGSFRPDGLVTGHEFLKILLCALGYDQEAEKFVNDARWEYNVLTAALKNGLTKGFSGDLGEALKRDDAALMAANAVYASTVRYDQNMRPQATGVSFGEANLGLTTISGILAANSEAAIEGQSITESGSIVLVGEHAVLLPLESGRAQLGDAVSALVSVKNSSALIAEDGSYNSAAIARGYGEIRTDDERTVELDAAKDKLAEGAKFYINYKQATAEEFAAIGAGHRVRAISNNGDSLIDLVIVEKMSFGEVTNVSSSGVVTVGGSRFTGENAVGLDELVKGDKVLYFSVEGGKTIFERPEILVGTASGYTSSYLLIDGAKFEAATGIDGFKPSDAPLGEEATYFLLDGKVVGCTSDKAETPANYALALRATRVGWEWRVELVDKSGAKATYVLANPSDVIVENDLPAGLYDLTINDEGQAVLKVVDVTGQSTESAINFTSGTPKLGEKFVTSKTVFFLEIDGEWKVFNGMANTPSFVAEAGERTVYGVAGDLYGSGDMVAVAAISGVKLADETAENHFVVLGDVLTVAGGKVSFAAWDGSEIANFTSTLDNIAAGGVYKFTLSADGSSVVAAETIDGAAGVLTDAGDLVLRVGTAGSEDGEIFTYTESTKVIIVDLTKNTAEFGSIADLSTTPADAVAELEEGTADTLVVAGESGNATHIYQFITE